MKGGRQPLGYTIVELLIVLAVSGLMFAIAASFVNGKQERTSFQQGSNELVSRLQAVIEQITDGQYTDIPFTCQDPGGALPLQINGTVAPNQGTNPDCVFLGKIVHFSVSGNRNQYETFSLAGARVTNGGAPVPIPVTTILASKLRPIIGTGIDLTSKSTIPQDLSVVSMSVTDSSGGVHNPAYDVGFIQGLGSPGSIGTYDSGAQAIQMVFVPMASSTLSESGAAGLITATNVQTAQSVCIGVSDGSRSARITIGGNSSQLSVSIQQLGQVGAVSCP